MRIDLRSTYQRSTTLPRFYSSLSSLTRCQGHISCLNKQVPQDAPEARPGLPAATSRQAPVCWVREQVAGDLVSAPARTCQQQQAAQLGPHAENYCNSCCADAEAQLQRKAERFVVASTVRLRDHPTTRSLPAKIGGGVREKSHVP